MKAAHSQLSRYQHWLSATLWPSSESYPVHTGLASPTMEKLQAEWLCFEGSLYSQSLLLKPHPGTDQSRTQTPELYSKGPCSASGQFWS